MTTAIQQAASENLYVGVDIGGTKIQASLITESGSVLANNRLTTPRGCPVDVTLEAIATAVDQLLANRRLGKEEITALGMAVPGVVEQDSGFVVVTPNMNLSGMELGRVMRERFGIPVAIGNDCNLGTLGECWLGSGRNAGSCVGIFVGTGIGAGIVRDLRVVVGAGQAAGEIGHIVSQIPCEDWRSGIGTKKKTESPKNGSSGNEPSLPRCGCGNYGCFETFASRSAIERCIREAVESGAESIITELCGGKLDMIKSGTLAKALKAGDPVVTAIVHYASQVIGYACLTVRHLLDPDVIVLGGGVMEACQQFMMPVIDAVVSNDQLPSAPGNRRILVSSLGDNAVVLGAVALARSSEDSDALERIHRTTPKYPILRMMTDNVIHIADTPYADDFYMSSNGEIRPRKKTPKKNPDGFRLRDLEAAAIGGVDLIILATPKAGEIALSGKCQNYLYHRGIDYRILPLDEAVQTFNTSAVRRSAVFHFSRD